MRVIELIDTDPCGCRAYWDLATMQVVAERTCLRHRWDFRYGGSEYEWRLA